MTTLGIDIGGSSVKAAAIRDGQVLWTTRSDAYDRPTAARLIAAIAEALAGRGDDATTVGLCVPGILDDARERVMRSVNVPAVCELPLRDLIGRALRRPIDRLTITSDAVAAAHDLYISRRLTGRLLTLVLGTGIGAAVIDDNGPLRVSGDSPGHFGQLDVSVPGHPVVGPDGGAGSLEGYLGAPAIHARYGPDGPAAMRADDPPALALVRALRIAHAIYRPQHVILAGGIGNRLGHLVESLRKQTAAQLTSIAHPDWTLSVGDNDHHAAVGAARLAKREGD